MEFFNVVAILSIISGGVISAFSARHPTRLVMWLTSYLVLIEGLMQLGLSLGWQQLNLPTDWTVIVAFSVYNLGNAAVITGRTLKSHSSRSQKLVYMGGALLAVSMLLLLWSIRQCVMSWNLAWFMILVVIILISMPIGLILSARRHINKK